MLIDSSTAPKNIVSSKVTKPMSNMVMGSIVTADPGTIPDWRMDIMSPSSEEIVLSKPMTVMAKLPTQREATGLSGQQGLQCPLSFAGTQVYCHTHWP